MSSVQKRYLVIILLAIISGSIALPQRLSLRLPWVNREVVLGSPRLNTTLFGKPVSITFSFKQGLDIQGGMQVVLEADMSNIAVIDRQAALESVREVLLRRVDLYGISEPVVQTAIAGESYRVVIELPGVTNETEALALVGKTAELSFQLLEEKPIEISPDASTAAEIDFSQFMSLKETGLSGSQLKRATVQFDQNTGEPQVGIQFDEAGSRLFADVTREHTGERLAIILDGTIVMAPNLSEPILGGQAQISGGFTLDQAKQLSIQLNAGALPVPITVLEQRTIGASLGSESVRASLQAGLLGILLVMLFMILYYGWSGVLASMALSIYALLTIALYKIFGVTITVPGLAGLLLSIGMAVDANILIFERMKEEQRMGRPFLLAMELGFGRAWDSIKDANLATIMTAVILVNPLNLPFLNSSGLVRGFGITLLIGVVLGLFTGVFVTRTLVRLYLREKK
ncbi:MAG: protein-export membrane protein SecD [Candidatus Pacebacteria bacterium RIFCSPHIGHO2_01_FULL_46_16]|nr:MAG: protein-export membrane protein SecD [Candidatus Pacebacteria bacterium RIFCSPHIGHO2_01_FULL_46_16]OGJ21789.1 MAG: protein-export membrane protein SecD [Candidatus Pacebacteria bacterium RIFCSPHIGHO2_02_FULL_46_9]